MINHTPEQRTSPDERLAYSEEEAARQLSLSPRTLYSLRKNGEIRAKEVGGRIIYARADLEEFLTRKAKASTTINS